MKIRFLNYIFILVAFFIPLNSCTVSKGVYSNLDVALKEPSSVVELDLSGKNMHCLPSEIVKLINLKKLNIGNNDFTVFPKEIFSFRKLEVLFLYGNLIDTIPSEIQRLQNLRVLWLHDNNISEMPEEIKELKKLEGMTVRGNPLGEEGVNKLKELLPNCKIYYLP